MNSFEYPPRFKYSPILSSAFEPFAEGSEGSSSSSITLKADALNLHKGSGQIRPNDLNS
jgi:hypothetical protein